jgi:hypothetical protein
VPHLPAAGDELRGRVIVEADEASSTPLGSAQCATASVTKSRAAAAARSAASASASAPLVISTPIFRSAKYFLATGRRLPGLPAANA